MYHLIDTHTGKTIRTYPEQKARQARAYRDRLDAAYGAVRYVVRWIEG